MAHRIGKLAAHLSPAPASASAASPLVNKRPGDEAANPVPTSFFVKGAFRPVTKELSTDLSLSSCCIEGKVPVGLRGTFFRIGPNPRFDFENKPYHVFDGDGMIHKVCKHFKNVQHAVNSVLMKLSYVDCVHCTCPRIPSSPSHKSHR